LLCDGLLSHERQAAIILDDKWAIAKKHFWTGSPP
jgi:hypothetical protein